MYTSSIFAHAVISGGGKAGREKPCLEGDGSYAGSEQAQPRYTQPAGPRAHKTHRCASTPVITSSQSSFSLSAEVCSKAPKMHSKDGLQGAPEEGGSSAAEAPGSQESGHEAAWA